MKRFENKIVLITGGSSGIGLATAKRVISEGAKTIITGRDLNKLEQAVKELGASSSFIQADAANVSDLDQLFKEVEQKFGQLDVVFANAGGAQLFPIEHFTEAAFDTLVATNFKGVFFTVQKALPLLKKGSSVVINASVGSAKGVPTASVYNATKAAVRSLARCFAAELMEKGIRVNAVSPGPTATASLDNTPGIPPEALSMVKEQFAASVPMKRFGTSDEVAAAVAFLASDEASFITGIELFVDGGMAQL